MTMPGMRLSDGVSQIKVSNLPEIIRLLLNSISDKDLWVKERLLRSLSNVIEFKVAVGLVSGKEVKETFMAHATHADPYIRSRAIRSLRLCNTDPEVKKT